MKEPCPNCPFRSDRPFYLPSDRVLGIGHALTHDGLFPCHKNNANLCVGAISVLDKQCGAMSNVWARSAARCGAIDYPIAHTVPVYSSFEEAAIALSKDPND